MSHPQDTDDNLMAQCAEHVKKIFPGAGLVLVIHQPDRLPIMIHTYADDRDAAYILQSAQQHLGSVPARRYTLGPQGVLTPVTSLPHVGLATSDSDFDAD